LSFSLFSRTAEYLRVQTAGRQMAQLWSSRFLDGENVQAERLVNYRGGRNLFRRKLHYRLSTEIGGGAGAGRLRSEL